MEIIRSIEIVVTIDSNKRTVTHRVEVEDSVDAALAEIRELLEDYR